MLSKKRLPHERKCTPRQQAFIEEYARNGMKVVTAYKKAFTTTNDNTAYVAGMELLRKPWVERELKKHKTTLERRAARLGMDDESLLKQHYKLIFATKKIYNKQGHFIAEEEDLPIIKQGLELIYKLLGKYAAERHQFEGPGGKPLIPESDFSKLSKEELEKKREEVLKVLRGVNILNSL